MASIVPKTLLAVAGSVLAIAVVSACGDAGRSPVAPVQPVPSDTLTLSGDAVWLDPAGRTFLLDMNHEMRLVEVGAATSFVGTLRSIEAMRTAYESGYRVPAVARGIEYRIGVWPSRVAAFSVDARASETQLRPFGGPGDRGRIGLTHPQFWRFALIGGGRWEIFVTPSTILDPSGDFTTFDDLIAAMERDEARYISGEGWYVAEVGQNARTLKATRGPQ